MEFAKGQINVFRKIAKQVYYEEQAKNAREQVGKVVTSGSGATISVYINNSTTAVGIKNPRSFSLTTGQLVAIVRPNLKNDNSRYIDRIL